MSEQSGSGGAEVTLVWPTFDHLPSYADALQRGWSPDTLRAEAAREELERIAADPEAFVKEQVDREAAGPPVTLPDGTTAARLPGYRRWIWDGDFCGVIGLRWFVEGIFRHQSPTITIKTRWQMKVGFLDALFGGKDPGCLLRRRAILLL